LKLCVTTDGGSVCCRHDGRRSDECLAASAAIRCVVPPCSSSAIESADLSLRVDVRVGHVMLLAGPALHRLGSLACSVCVGGRRCVELPRLADFECVARTWRICKRRRPLGITTACPLWCAGSCPLGLGARPSFASFWRFREDACVTAHVWSL
jgi:hypothetical protein